MHIVKYFLKVITLSSSTCLIFSIVFMLGQASQYVQSTSELRYQTLQHWQRLYPEQSHVTHQFIDRCMNNPPRHQVTNEEIALYDCGKNLGAHALVDELQATDQTLKTLAWPLSLLELSLFVKSLS